MNIYLISEEFPPSTGWGGIAAYSYTFAQGLLNLGHQVQVIAGVAYGKEEENYVLGSIKVYRVKFKIYNRFLAITYFKILRRLLNFFFPISLNHLEFSYAVYRKIKEINKDEKIDILESPEYDLGALFCILLLKIPAVVKLHTPVRLNYVLNELKLNADVYMHDFLCRLMVRRADLVTSPSRAMLNRIAMIWGRNLPHITVFPNPIDDKMFKPGLNSFDSRFILYTGRLEKRKGVHILLDAFLKLNKNYPHIKLIMIGLDTDTFKDGKKRIFFREYMARKGIDDANRENIVLAGKLEREKLIEYYQHALFGVFPSESFDNFPYTCLEAMSCGLPMIYTSSGGVEEMMVDGKTGIAVNIKDSEGIYSAMLKMLQDRALLKQMSYNARKRVEENYALNSRCIEAVKLYKEVIKTNA